MPLLAALKDLSFAKAFRIGFLAGMAHYLTLLYWLVYTMQTYGGLPLYLAVPLLFLLSAYMAIYVGLFSALISRLTTNRFISYLMAVSVFWVFLEYLRGFLFTGFPWSFLGYSQFKQLHIIQISDIFGVYGISFLLAFSNALLYGIFNNFFGKKIRNHKQLQLHTTIGIVIFIALLVSALSYGKLQISEFEESLSKADFRRITVVQGNIDQAIKWNPEFQTATTEKYTLLSVSARKSNPDLVVWPETAVPFYFLYDAKLSEKVIEIVYEMESDFLIGSPSFKTGNEAIEYYNSAYLINAESKTIEKYDKVHLVPFGEYVPFKKWLPFLGKMVAQVGDFQSGEKGETLSWNNQKLGILICFEIIFPGLSRAMVQNGTDFLINITNDAWFGKTSAPYQHFSMAIFRAVENKRFLVRAANTGISGFIDPVGKVWEQSTLLEDAVLTKDIPIYSEITVYSRFGDFFAITCSLVSAVLICMGLVQKLSKN